MMPLTYFSLKSHISHLLYGLIMRAVRLGLKSRTRMFGGRLLVNERIVEYPQIFQWIRRDGRVLDIGCASSRLFIQLASLSYEVHGIDSREYPFQHPNFQFHQVDLFEWSPEFKFDIVTAISVIEHFGIGSYGDVMIEDADRRAVKKIAKLLALHGQLLVSVPFGKRMTTSRYRVYDLGQLLVLFSGFQWLDAAYFQRVKGRWMPSTAEELAGISSPKPPVNGVLNLELLSEK